MLAGPTLGALTNFGTVTRKSLYGVATDSRQLVTVGVEGIILRSPVLPDLTPINILSYSRLVTPGTSVAQNLFLLAGKPDQRFTLDYTSSLTRTGWTTGPQLEFYDNGGTLYYLETIPLSNAPPAEFYRATLAP